MSMFCLRIRSSNRSSGPSYTCPTVTENGDCEASSCCAASLAAAAVARFASNSRATGPGRSTSISPTGSISSSTAAFADAAAATDEAVSAKVSAASSASVPPGRSSTVASFRVSSAIAIRAPPRSAPAASSARRAGSHAPRPRSESHQPLRDAPRSTALRFWIGASSFNHRVGQPSLALDTANPRRGAACANFCLRLVRGKTLCRSKTGQTSGFPASVRRMRAGSVTIVFSFARTSGSGSESRIVFP